MQWPEMTEEQKSLWEQVRLFCQRKIAPIAAEIDRSGEFPRDLLREAKAMGLCGLMVPEEFGGAAMDTVSYAMAIEEVASACASTAVILSVMNSLVAAPLLEFGSDFQKEKYLKKLVQGESWGCFALSEPGHGSNPAGLQCRAVRTEAGYRLRGTKNWITNGKEAHLAIVFATLDPSLKHRGIAAFCVETDRPGFQVSKVEDKLGITGSSTAQLFLEEVEIPKENLLGSEDQGFKIAMHTLDGGRIGIASQALGIGRAALEASKKFAKEREQFGAPLARLQAIQFFIADMATRLQGARLLTWFAARLKDRGESYTEASAMAKLAASEAAMWIATKAIQVHGGYGYTKEYPVERHFRDAKITEIYEGTSEIQRLVIAALQLNP